MGILHRLCNWIVPREVDDSVFLPLKNRDGDWSNDVRAGFGVRVFADESGCCLATLQFDPHCEQTT
jgi:hypothetical protein